MSVTAGDLLDVDKVANPGALMQQNVSVLRRMLWMFFPTYQTGVPNTACGKPSAGTHLTNEIWVDVNGATFFCTAGGSPGTWRQIKPAVVASQGSVSGTKPDGYWICDETNHFKMYYWNLAGTAWVAI